MNDELRLIRKIQKNGNRIAADTLIRRYYDEIYRYVYRQTMDKDIAMDLTQEIFISMLSTIAHFDGKKAGFRTWLYKIATNKTVDYFRSRAVHRKQILVIDDLELADETDFIHQLEDADLVEQIMEYINELPAELQQIFRLKLYSEYTFTEIAELLSMPESSVKSKYYRLLRTLRREFQNEYDGD
ncbi:ECF RNA polymerase sigma factor SigW [Clostridia bacterium]|nr:ECF RNA polymerase sigma factor SigW [Clostridia bacterium]